MPTALKSVNQLFFETIISDIHHATKFQPITPSHTKLSSCVAKNALSVYHVRAMSACTSKIIYRETNDRTKLPFSTMMTEFHAREKSSLQFSKPK